MMRERSRVLIKLLILAPYLAVLYILQSTLLTHLPIFGTTPMIMPLAVCGVALFLGRVDGGVTGLFAGMLMDLACNQATIHFTLVLTLTGLLVGILSDTVLVQGFPSYLLTAAAALAVCSASQVFALAVLRGAPIALLSGIAVRQTLSSLIFTFPFYYISRFLCRVM